MKLFSVVAVDRADGLCLTGAVAAAAAAEGMDNDDDDYDDDDDGDDDDDDDDDFSAKGEGGAIPPGDPLRR